MISPFILAAGLIQIVDVLAPVPIKFQERMQSVPMVSQQVETCQSYRLWQYMFNQRKTAVLQDRVDYLSWDEFVFLKKGNVLPDVEAFCKDK